MRNIKDLIQNTFNNTDNLNNTLNTLSDIQSNLMKNYSNPVFSKDGKNKIMNMYNTVKDLGKSLYKFASYKQNNMSMEAEDEKQTGSDIVLKGGISNVKYVWHSENGENTCDKCKALDGTTYDFADEVPERPHPDCKCHVEIVEDKKENRNLQENTTDKFCDCVEITERLISEIEDSLSIAESITNYIQVDIADIEEDSEKLNNMINEAEETLTSFESEYGRHLPECENNIDKEYGEIYATKDELQILLKDITGLLSPSYTLLNVVKIFISNYIALLYEAYILKQSGMDKYRHSKANCEAAQQSGILGSKIAAGLSDLKEYYDQFTYVHTHKVTLEEAIADSERDQVANRLGRERGRLYTYCSCSILMNDLKPAGKK